MSSAMPTAIDDDLTQRMQHLLEALSQDNPDLAIDVVFPRDGWMQSKEGSEPQKSYEKLVTGAFKRAVESNRRKLKGVEHAKYVSFDLGHQIVQLPSGKKNFKMPLWRVRHSKIKFTIDGKEHALDINEMTAWRGAWYVTRLR